jgi:AcrR family transcriptional regulator
MDEIARASGLSKGGIYFHFESKREIFRALVQQEYDVTMAAIDGVMSETNSVPEMLIELAGYFMELFTNSDRPRFMVIIGEMALRDEEIQEQLKELQTNYFDRIAELLNRGVEAGQVRECDARSMAIVLKSMLDGMQANLALGMTVDVEETLTAAMDLLAHGLIQMD